MLHTGNSRLMKRINRSLLLEAIWSQGPVSRADLAKSMRLSPATVSAIIDQLIKEGLVFEQGLGESQGGRRPVLLSLNPNARTVVAVYVSVDGIQAALTNLHGAVLRQASFPIDLTSAQSALQGIEAAVASLLPDAQTLGAPVLGIGVACPGLIDRHRGVLRYSTSLGQEQLAIGPTLEQKFGLLTVVDNDQNAAALAELHVGVGQGHSNFVYISVDSGIGAGIVIDGSLYGGSLGAAGEFGHITVDVNGPPCRCGNRGCLGVLAGGAAMLSQAVRMVQQRADTALADYCNSDIGRLRIEHVMRGVREKDRVAVSIFEMAMEYLGAGVASLVNLMAPELIILGGSVVRQSGSRVIDSVSSAVHQRALRAHCDHIRIVSASEGPNSGLIGAALLVIHGFRFELRTAV